MGNKGRMHMLKVQTEGNDKSGSDVQTAARGVLPKVEMAMGRIRSKLVDVRGGNHQLAKTGA